jgi:hypothetical protein
LHSFSVCQHFTISIFAATLNIYIRIFQIFLSEINYMQFLWFMKLFKFYRFSKFRNFKLIGLWIWIRFVAKFLILVLILIMVSILGKILNFNFWGLFVRSTFLTSPSISQYFFFIKLRYFQISWIQSAYFIIGNYIT